MGTFDLYDPWEAICTDLAEPSEGTFDLCDLCTDLADPCEGTFDLCDLWQVICPDLADPCEGTFDLCDLCEARCTDLADPCEGTFDLCDLCVLTLLTPVRAHLTSVTSVRLDVAWIPQQCKASPGLPAYESFFSRQQSAKINRFTLEKCFRRAGVLVTIEGKGSPLSYLR